MKKTIFMVFLLLLAVACAPQTTGGQGRAVFTITDAAASMGAVTSIKITVDSVQVHSTEEGWTTVSSDTKTYDLLQLKAQGTQALLADVKLNPGTYQQVRLDILKVVVTDSSGDHVAKLPSGDLKIVGDLVVNANSTSTATFDFSADESLHVTGKGEYILAPVVHLETREDADVDARSREDVKIKNGRVKTSIKVGMDAQGDIGVGVKIPAKVNITIENGVIKVSGKGRVVASLTDAANLTGVSSIKLTVDKVEVHSADKGWVNLSSQQKTYDLLQLRDGTKVVLADIQLASGTYEQIRLGVSKVIVVDVTGMHEAKLPSGELKIVGNLVVNPNSTSSLAFDFIAEKSLHITGKGQYIFAPVIKIQTKQNADVEVDTDKKVKIMSGDTDTDEEVGMDIDGSVKENLEIDDDLEIESGKIVKTGEMRGKAEVNISVTA